MKAADGRFDVAVFPVLETVLFPGVTLPLRIFEERFWQMLQDVQARQWPLAVALVTPTGGEDFKLSTICGAGTVQIFREHPDERSVDILVHGERRIKLLDFVQKEPYLVMEAQTIEVVEPLAPQVTNALSRSFDDFKTLMRTWVFLNPDWPESLSMIFDEFTGFSELCDFFAFHFLKKAGDKQAYLSCADPLERADRLARFLETDLDRLGRKMRRTQAGALFH